MSNDPSTFSKTRFLLRSWIDFLMGGIIGMLGLFFLVRGRFPMIPVNKYFGEPDATDWLFGGICIAYAVWRVVRGKRKSE